MSETININVKATDKGLHVLVWAGDDEGDTQCLHDHNIPWHRIADARAKLAYKLSVADGTPDLGNFNITFEDDNVSIEEIE